MPSRANDTQPKTTSPLTSVSVGDVLYKFHKGKPLLKANGVQVEAGVDAKGGRQVRGYYLPYNVTAIGTDSLGNQVPILEPRMAGGGGGGTGTGGGSARTMVENVFTDPNNNNVLVFREKKDVDGTESVQYTDINNNAYTPTDVTALVPAGGTTTATGSATTKDSEVTLLRDEGNNNELIYWKYLDDEGTITAQFYKASDGTVYTPADTTQLKAFGSVSSSGVTTTDREKETARYIITTAGTGTAVNDEVWKVVFFDPENPTTKSTIWYNNTQDTILTTPPNAGDIEIKENAYSQPAQSTLIPTEIEAVSNGVVAAGAKYIEFNIKDEDGEAVINGQTYSLDTNKLSVSYPHIPNSTYPQIDYQVLGGALIIQTIY